MSSNVLHDTNLEAHRGTRTTVRLPVAEMSGGSRLDIVVHAVVGSKPGPTLVLIGGQHGNEIGSIAGVHKAVEALNPSAMSGTVLAVPVSNPLSFELGARSTWVDAMYGGTTGNLNRAWPGNPDGFLTERIAYAISHNVLSKADFVIDFHATTKGSISIYYGYTIAGDDQTSKRATELALAFGMEIMLSETAKDTGSSGTKLMDYMNRNLRVPCTAVEIGEFYGFDRQATPVRRPIEVAVTGVTNVMKAMGILSGELRLPPRQLVVAPEQRCQPAHGGLLYPAVTRRDIGSVLEGGTVLGRVVSPYTFEVLHELRAPFEQSVLLSALDPEDFSRVNPGDQAFHCGDLKRGRWIENA